MLPGPDLAQLTDQPELTVSIGGRDYRFSELPIEALGRLQQWIKDHVPHPLQALVGVLDGLPDADRRYLLESARQEARVWPPIVSTSAGQVSLLSTEPGQLAAFLEGLRVHQPDMTEAEALRLFRRLERDARAAAKAAAGQGRRYDGEGPIGRIYATLFGLGPYRDPEETPGPKAAAAGS